MSTAKPGLKHEPSSAHIAGSDGRVSMKPFLKNMTSTGGGHGIGSFSFLFDERELNVDMNGVYWVILLLYIGVLVTTPVSVSGS